MAKAGDLPFTRGAYLGAALAITALGAGIGASLGFGAAQVWGGCLGAWAVQAGSFWVLWDRLRGREEATAAWVAGMAARLGGLGALAGLHYWTRLELRDAAVAYASTLMVLLWAEALWLARATGAALFPGGDGGPGSG